MEFIKRILGIATFIAMICGIVFLSNLFAKLDDAVKFSILGVIVLIIICTWISRRISHRKKANMLTQDFLCSKHNEAVEYALSRPQRERMRPNLKDILKVALILLNGIGRKKIHMRSTFWISSMY